jgi:hypothetical protein
MRSLPQRSTIVFALIVVSSLCGYARADLIRSKASRSFPDIAGDIVGKQTYTYDPITRTGTFAVVNAPHMLTMGPSAQDMRDMLPNPDGTLTQTLQMKLDSQGRIIPSPENHFEIRGTVFIGGEPYHGILLEGQPTDFGADPAATSRIDQEVFDLNMKITGGSLKWAFGDDAYLRIKPQEKSTFTGLFTADFSSDKPLTNLRPARKELPAAVPEPTTLVLFFALGSAYAIRRGRRYLVRKTPRRAPE